MAMEALLAGHYQIVKHLGSGGFGQTFLAQDCHLPGKPICVVKQLQPSAKEPSSLAVAKRLFDREAETLYRLGNHNQIPRLLAHFEQNQEFYLVQEYIEGQTLDQEIRATRQFTEAAVVALLQDLLLVLAFVHEEQVIHRDIKPSNLIRRSQDGRIVLIDFGAVKEVSVRSNSGSGDTSLTVAIGSPAYMPSEQRAFQPRYSSDLYAVGIIAMQTLSGLHPKSLPVDASTGELSCTALNPTVFVSPSLAAIVNKMVRYDYRQRYENASEALAALQQLLSFGGLDYTYPAASTSAASTSVPPVSTPPVSAPPVSAPLIPLAAPDLPLEQTIHRATGALPPTPEALPTIPALVDLPDGVKRQLEQLLAEYIGPIAAILLKAALAQVVTPEELLDRLISSIPEKQRSQFKKRATQILQDFSNSPTSPSQRHSIVVAAAPSSVIPSTPTSDPGITPEFVKQCELELTRFIGPIAPLLIRRTLSRHPDLSAVQLINTLVQHLNDPKTIEPFRRALLALL